MATNSAFQWYDKGVKNLNFAGVLTSTLKVALVYSTYVPDKVNDEFFDVDVSLDELITLNGYTTGGIELITKTVTIGLSPGEWRFGSDQPIWTIAGGDVTARYWVLYDDTPVSNKPLVGYGLLDDTNIDVTTLDGFLLTIGIPATGWFSTTKTDG